MTLRTTLLKLGAAASGLTASVSAFAADTLDKGDTAWMLVATVLVLFMTIPGIALFYAGMARKKNILGTIAQDFAICGVVTILWFVIGYSLAFSEGNSFIGGLSFLGMQGIGVNTLQGSIPQLLFAVVGAAVLWVGWMGFNGGSGLAADGRAAMAIVVSQIAAAGGLVAWMAAEWAYRGKPSLLGMISGAIAGLVGITPGSGFVEPLPALAIGIAAGLVCFWSVTILKRKLGYDDALDGWGVHGVGGIVGALLTGVFATARVTGTDLPPVMTQVGIQALSVIATLVYGGLMSGVILYVIDKVMGLRVSADDEQIGLDLALHGERIE